MSDADNLQFDRAEPAGAGALASCRSCSRPLEGAYYEVNGAVVCAPCRAALAATWNQGSRAGSFVQAVGLGLFAAAAGTAIYYAVLRFANLQLSLIAILVGFMVGTAVRKGSRGMGGIRYQVLAVFLTYTSIVASFIPVILRELGPGARFPVTLESIGFLYTLPFRDILSLIIVAIGLFEAWKLNKPASLLVTGPYQVGPPSAPGQLFAP